MILLPAIVVPFGNVQVQIPLGVVFVVSTSKIMVAPSQYGPVFLAVKVARATFDITIVVVVDTLGHPVLPEL